MLQLLQPIRRAFRRSPVCNQLMSRVLPLYRIVAVRGDTEIVIDGYPRCANTFAVVAFQLSQPREVGIAHHLHSLGQIRRGVQLGLPVLVVIRAPREAVLSLTVFRELPSVRWALDEYLDFYQGIVDLGDAVALADFSSVTTDFGSVIRRVNERFGSSFAEFDHNDANVAACYARIDEIERGNSGGEDVRTTRVARPSKERDAQKQALAAELQLPEIKRLLDEAEQLYQTLVTKHACKLRKVIG